MPPDLSADAIRSRTFPGALRGYDKDAVDAFRDEVADRLGELETRLERLDTRLTQLGIAEPPDLDAEIRRVAGDLTSILDEARRTATEMRERATEDAARWRSTAESEAAAMRAQAQADAEGLRGSAWQLATELLDTSTGEVDQRLDAARQDALFIRAEAEREELRTGAEARRAAEDLLRSARAEAEQISLDARAESERVLDAARRSAEVAQERARALEARRSELLRELEATRRSIDELESQMDDAEADAEVGASDRPPTYEPDPSVRIVPAREVIVPGIVDADEMAAEVERMRVAPATRDATSEPEPEPLAATTGPVEAQTAGDSPESTGGDEAAPDLAELEADPVEEPAAPAPVDSETVSAPPAEAQPQTAAPESVRMEPEVPEGPATPVADAPTDDERRDVPPASAAEEPAVEARPTAPHHGAAAAGRNGTRPSTPEDLVSARPAGISDLFDSLRGGGDTESRPPPDPSPADIGAGSLPPVDEPSVAGVAPASAKAAPGTPVRTAIDLRDRLLLPAQNQALRTLKRSIVDLQNVVLESMRLADGSWAPERAAFADAVRPPVADLTRQAYELGVLAAGELSGSEPPGSEAEGAPADHSADVADAMVASVEDSLAHAVARSAGQREITAAVSRVFRAWRTDEAERRLRMAAYNAYHEGVVAGLAALEVAAVTAVTLGRRCAECPAATGQAWDPAGPMPEGMVLPPAHPECATTVVPAVAAAVGAADGKQRVRQ